MRTTVCLSLLGKRAADIREELAVGETCEVVNFLLPCSWIYSRAEAEDD